MASHSAGSRPLQLLLQLCRARGHAQWLRCNRCGVPHPAGYVQHALLPARTCHLHSVQRSVGACSVASPFIELKSTHRSKFYSSYVVVVSLHHTGQSSLSVNDIVTSGKHDSSGSLTAVAMELLWYALPVIPRTLGCRQTGTPGGAQRCSAGRHGPASHRAHRPR